MSPTQRQTAGAEAQYLDGQLLIAMPSMSDANFARSVVYLCAHSEEGAMGLIINQRARDITFLGLLKQLHVVGDDDDNSELRATLAERAVLLGGPVDTNRGFVLHSTDYKSEETTLAVRDEMGLTATLDVLRAIMAGQGPARSLLALGYAGWSPGQLETEIQANGWLHCAADPDLVFDAPIADKYELALASMGIDPSHLSSFAGHA
jgi:putative transcriptional regulator